MSSKYSIRQIHRWVSIAFTVGVIVNIVALAQKSQTFWVGLLALIPLITLLLTGLYLFALPYLPKRRVGVATAANVGGIDAA